MEDLLDLDFVQDGGSAACEGSKGSTDFVRNSLLLDNTEQSKIYPYNSTDQDSGHNHQRDHGSTNSSSIIDPSSHDAAFKIPDRVRRSLPPRRLLIQIDDALSWEAVVHSLRRLLALIELGLDSSVEYTSSPNTSPNTSPNSNNNHLDQRPEKASGAAFTVAIPPTATAVPPRTTQSSLRPGPRKSPISNVHLNPNLNSKSSTPISTSASTSASTSVSNFSPDSTRSRSFFPGHRYDSTDTNKNNDSDWPPTPKSTIVAEGRPVVFASPPAVVSVSQVPTKSASYRAHPRPAPASYTTSGSSTARSHSYKHVSGGGSNSSSGMSGTKNKTSKENPRTVEKTLNLCPGSFSTLPPPISPRTPQFMPSQGRHGSLGDVSSGSTTYGSGGGGGGHQSSTQLNSIKERVRSWQLSQGG